MGLLEKCSRYTAAASSGSGLYPYFQPIEPADDTEVVIRGERKIMVGSNNYLGLTHHPYVLEKAQDALYRYGTGCTGSRFLNGTLDLHVELEDDARGADGHRGALVFSTGYQTNLGVISTLAAAAATIFLRQAEPRLPGGRRRRSSAATVHRYRARRPGGRCERQLERHCRTRRQADRHRRRVLDGGRHLRPAGAVALAERYGARRAGGRRALDRRAGRDGGGTAQHFGMEARWT